MKHILKQAGIMSISMAMVFGGAVTVFAQEAVDTSVSTESDVVTAGVVPGNPVFFLDRFAEFVQDAFTFDAKAKARLRVKFADERLAEIKLVLEDKDVSNRGVDRARQALARDVDRAESFIAERSDELGDIKVELEQELAKNETEFLKEISQKQSELVKAQIELRKKIEALEKGNDTDNSLPGLQSEFESIQKDILGLGEDFDEFEIEIEDEDEDEGEDDDSQETVHDRAQQAGQRMAQAYEERAKAVERLAKEKAEGSLTAGAQAIFDAADDFLDQSERAFKSGSYVQAEYYAERAKKVFNDARSGKNFAPGQVEKESDDSSDDESEIEDSDDVDDDADDEESEVEDENDDDSDDNDSEDDNDDDSSDNSGSGNSGSDNDNDD